eukprot:TRINITY_DN4019_c1_g1_i2.p1 TRINITY_DN4019_c1_g1~~TRINITY_DN4019_c1_g1_i2.p1  ORF type:complete len:373 (-),score=96.15 TRINITY_DN4019_c1_g1_i2:5-1123(-)
MEYEIEGLFVVTIVAFKGEDLKRGNCHLCSSFIPQKFDIPIASLPQSVTFYSFANGESDKMSISIIPITLDAIDKDLELEFKDSETTIGFLQIHLHSDITKKPKQSRNITTDYTLSPEIYLSQIESNYKALKKESGSPYLIKAISKNKLEDINTYINFISLIKKLKHNNLLCLYDIYHNKDHVFQVHEDIPNDLLFAIQCKPCFTEALAANYIYQLIGVIQFLSSHGLHLTNLQYSNLLYSNDVLKLDFGYDCHYGLITSLVSVVTTPDAVSPEVLCGEEYLDEKTAAWCIGVVAYVLLSAQDPFCGENDGDIDLFKHIIEFSYSFPEEYWGIISEEAKDFISSIFVGVSTRPSLSQLLEHPWIKKMETLSV